MRSTSGSRYRAGFAGFCIVLTIGACSDGQGAPTPDEASPPNLPLSVVSSSVPPITGARQDDSGTGASDVATPDDVRPYGQSGDALIWNVREELTRRCMAEDGFDYIINPPPATDTPDPIPRLSVADAEQNGYRGSFASESIDPEPRVAADAQDPAYAEALDPQDDANRPGCFESAYDQLFGSTGEPSAIDLYRAIEGQDIIQDVETLPEFATLLDEWSGCMTQQGYDFANPGQPFFQFAGPESTTPLGAAVSDGERATAMSDAQCRQDIDYEMRYERLYNERYTSWANEHGAQLTAVQMQAQSDLDHAKQVAGELGI